MSQSESTEHHQPRRKIVQQNWIIRNLCESKATWEIGRNAEALIKPIDLAM